MKGRGRSIPTSYTPAFGAGTESTVALPEVTYNQPRYVPPSDSPPTYDKGLPGYGGGEMDKKETESMRTAVEDDSDPFADYDELPRLK